VNDICYLELERTALSIFRNIVCRGGSELYNAARLSLNTILTFTASSVLTVINKTSTNLTVKCIHINKSVSVNPSTPADFFFGTPVIINSNCTVQKNVDAAKEPGRVDILVCITARTSRWCQTVRRGKKWFIKLRSHLKGVKCTVQVVNATSKCTAANISAGDLLDVPDRPRWKDAEVCEDVKLFFVALHVLHDDKAHSATRGNSPETADRSQTGIYCLEVIAATLSRERKKTLQDE